MIVQLNNIEKTDLQSLYEITSNENIMKYVKDDNKWDMNRTKKFMQYCLDKQRINNEERNVFYYKILIDNKLKGIIGIREYKTLDNYKLILYLNKSKKNIKYAVQAITLLIDKIITLKKNIIKITSYVSIEDIVFKKICEQIGFVLIKNTFDNKKYKKYIYHIKLHNILTLEYPYLKYFISKDEITQSFNLLSNYKPVFKSGNINHFSNNMSIIINYDKERNINKITDYFTDKCRVRCIFKGKKYSPLEYYSLNKGELVTSSIISKKFNIDQFEKNLFNQLHTKFCNNFNTTVAFSLYKIFKPKSIFDSSAGWGDRLIAALAYGANYTGVDPSKCLEPLYKKIIKTLKKDDNEYKIINSGIEDVNIKKNEYDFCLTSPPFFDLEVYEENKNQSIKKFTTFNKWEREFLIILVNKNIKILKRNGYLALYIPGNYKYFMNYMKKHKKIVYKGIFSFLTPKKRDIHIWKKI